MLDQRDYEIRDAPFLWWFVRVEAKFRPFSLKFVRTGAQASGLIGCCLMATTSFFV